MDQRERRASRIRITKILRHESALTSTTSATERMWAKTTNVLERVRVENSKIKDFSSEECKVMID